MKRKFEHPAPPASEQTTGPRYWRSLDELADTPGFRERLAREFPAGADSMQGVDRRNFFKLMAASFALGGIGLAAGCRRPEENILPYGKSVEGVIPGLPQYYATAMPLRHGAIPLLAETHQGRPTKLEGNPSYARYGGATTLRAQAALLELYDPDRATTHTIKGAPADPAAVNQLLAKINAAHTADGGAGLAILAQPSTSSSRARLVTALKAKFPAASWAEYDATPDESSASSVKVYGVANVKPVYHFDRAKRVLSLDADFLAEGPHALAYARDFATARRVKTQADAGNMNRLYVVESNFTITGSMADHRLRLASGDVLRLAAALVGKLPKNALDPFSKPVDAPAFKDNAAWIDACVQDLVDNKGHCIIIAGPHQPETVHQLVHAMNFALDNYGRTLNLAALPDLAPADSIEDLAKSMAVGKVKTLVVLGGNPAYNAPADLEFSALLKKVPEVVRLGYYVDETSQLAGTHLGEAHFLESWGDARTYDGTIVPVQPMILPLFNGLTEIEVLARLAGEETTDPYAIVRATFDLKVPGNNEQAFRKFLHDGFREGSYWGPAKEVPGANSSDLTDMVSGLTVPAPLSVSNLEVRFVADLKLDDGRYANNGWLQECPDPITKITWDNAISVSPKLGKALGIDPKGSLLQVARTELSEMDRGREYAFMGELTLPGGKKISGPMHIQPGLADWTVILPLGYGRAVSGRVGGNDAHPVGHNFYPGRTSAAPHFLAGAKLTVTGKRYDLGTTQEHWSMEGRDLVREANAAEVTAKEGPGLNFIEEVSLEEPGVVLGEVGSKMTLGEQATEIPRGNSLYVTPVFDVDQGDHNAKGPHTVHQWGMSIDLNTCIGCNACVVACQAENNIPIVGKDQVMRGRVMHWIRLDRYYTDGHADAAAFGADGNREIPEDTQTVVQPVGCQHCELAPCEMVCPVNATVHDAEGINTMAYNRCIGTRYCANNCPYKVRRFNYFDFNKRSIDSLYLGPLGPSGMPELAKLAKNPEVTVRMRGVMEKCTYCIQRVELGKMAQKRIAGSTDNVAVPDGAIKTACQQVCPVSAIVFGNIKDPKSQVSLAKAQDQDYALLGYLNIRPRTTYLAKLRNPNPAMPGYQNLPYSRQEFNAKNHPAGFTPEVPEPKTKEPKGEEKKPAADKASLLSPGKLLGGLS